MMQQYKVKPNSFDAIRKQSQNVVIFLCIALSLFLLAVIGFSEVIFIIVPILFVFMILGTRFMADKWQKPVFDSYILTITDDALIRHQLNTPTLTILKSEIAKIVKGKYGDMVVTGNNKLIFISIPSQIEDYSTLENELNNICPLIIQTKIITKPFFIAILLGLTVGLSHYLLSEWATTKTQIVFLGSLNILIQIALSILIYWHKNIDTNFKKIIIILALLQCWNIFFLMYSKLKGI